MIFKSCHKDIKIPTNQTINDILNLESNLEAFMDSETGKSLKYKDLNAEVKLLASGLYNELGLRKGDVICVFAKNSIYYPLIILASSLLGCISTCCNNNYTTLELKHQVEDSKAKIIITFKENLNVVEEAVGKRVQIVLMDDNLKYLTLKELCCNSPFPKLKFKNGEAKTTSLLLLYSSGTTGKPKAVSLTHYHLISNMLQHSVVEPRMKKGSQLIGILPFYHCYGITVNIFCSLYRQCTMVIMTKFEPNHFLKTIERYKIEASYAPPPIILALNNLSSTTKYNLKSFKWIISGAAPLSSDLAKNVCKKLGIQIHQAYGLTETSPIATYPDPNSNNRQYVGKLLPNVIAKVIGIDNGKELKENQVGELWIKGPNVIEEYYLRPSNTLNCFQDGYFKTGDVVKIDLQGQVYVVDRIKELIKYNGLQIAPAELEAILLAHPNVLDCCVIPIPDKSSGEVPKAFVVLNQKDIKLDQIVRFVDDKVAYFKKLRGGIEALDSIPRSLAGKILRRILVEKERSKSKL